VCAAAGFYARKGHGNGISGCRLGSSSQLPNPKLHPNAVMAPVAVEIVVVVSKHGRNSAVQGF